MHRRWLSWTLLSATVSAFYPYRPPEDEGGKEKRFYPIRVEEENVPVTLDLKKISHQKRDNEFPVILSSKPDMPDAMAIDEDGSDLSYFSVMKFGSKQQPMYMLIDTGSANTWVFDSQCQSPACQAHNTFGASDSNTLQVSDNSWSLTYGTGEVTGVIGHDTLDFANYSVDLGFGLATTASADFNNYPMDGILGLGPASSNELGVLTVMEVLDQQNLLRENIIGVHLQRESDGTKDGQITFGAVDKSKFDGDLSYTDNISSQNMWEIPVVDAAVDGQACQFTGKSAIIDTGTSYILMPLQDALTLHQLIPGSTHTGENFLVPCGATVKVQFTISGVTYSVGPEDYVGKPSGSACSSNIIGHQAFGPNQWIVGDVFLKSVYTVFDFDKNRIGFGVKSGEATTIEAPSPTSTHAASSTAHTTTHVPSAKTTMAKSTTTAKSSSSSSSTTATATPTTTPNSSPFGDASSAASRQDLSTGYVLLVALMLGLIL